MQKGFPESSVSGSVGAKCLAAGVCGRLSVGQCAVIVLPGQHLLNFTPALPGVGTRTAPQTHRNGSLVRRERHHPVTEVGSLFFPLFWKNKENHKFPLACARGVSKGLPIPESGLCDFPSVGSTSQIVGAETRKEVRC